MKIAKGIIVAFVILLVILIGYICFADTKSELPKEEKTNYKVSITKLNNREIYTLKPENKNQNKYILYFHGGAYMAAMEQYHWEFLEKVIEQTGYTVIVPDYPLAPKYTYKDVFDMVIPFYQEIIKDIKPENLIMMGDSAGGGLALALEEELTQKNIEVPNKLILISPWLDVTMSNPEIDNIQPKDKQLNKDTLKLAGIAYCGLNSMESYLINPINGPIKELKNVTIYTGTNDILNPDSNLFSNKCKEQRIDIKLKEYEEAEHIWIVRNEGEKVEEGFNDLIEEIYK